MCAKRIQKAITRSLAIRKSLSKHNRWPLFLFAVKKFPGQPNDEDGYYVFANCYGSKGKWCDKGPDQKLSYMCEYDL